MNDTDETTGAGAMNGLVAVLRLYAVAAVLCLAAIPALADDGGSGTGVEVQVRVPTGELLLSKLKEAGEKATEPLLRIDPTVQVPVESSRVVDAFTAARFLFSTGATQAPPNGPAGFAPPGVDLSAYYTQSHAAFTASCTF
jgi:hypothetical protein